MSAPPDGAPAASTSEVAEAYSPPSILTAKGRAELRLLGTSECQETGETGRRAPPTLTGPITAVYEDLQLT